jgi:hypothetical protein
MWVFLVAFIGMGFIPQFKGSGFDVLAFTSRGSFYYPSLALETDLGL